MRAPPRTRLSAAARGLAVVLLLLQAGADGAIALAHAAERPGGPPCVESQHTTSCVVLHDAARCAQCQYHIGRTLPAVQRRLPPPAGSMRSVGGPDESPRTPSGNPPPTTQPRAPPSSLS